MNVGTRSDNFFINENLTPVRQTIAYVLRKAERQLTMIISGSTSLDGKNYVWLKPPSPSDPDAKPVRHAVYTSDHLVKFCCKSLRKPATNNNNKTALSFSGCINCINVSIALPSHSFLILMCH